MKKYIVLSMIAVAGLAACKKKDTPPPATPETFYKVKDFTNAATGVAYTYEYNAQGQLLKEGRSNNLRRNEYAYSTGKVTESEYSTTGALNLTMEHQLNTDGLVFKTTYPPTSDYSERAYNSNKMTTSVVGYYSTGIARTDYFYTGKQLDSTVSKGTNGAVGLVSKYEYYTDVLNTISDQHQGRQFWGRQSPYAIKKITNIFYDASGAITNTQVINQAYEKDAQGRIVRVISTGFVNSTYDYTYF